MNGDSMQRKFKIKIRVTANYYEKTAPEDSEPFDKVVNDWYQNEGMKSLTDYLNYIDKDQKIPRTIPYYSSLKGFVGGDSVDKEAYD